jgi:hypothetical protein
MNVSGDDDTPICAGDLPPELRILPTAPCRSGNFLSRLLGGATADYASEDDVTPRDLLDRQLAIAWMSTRARAGCVTRR